MILHGIEYQHPISLNMRILADHVTNSFLAFMKSIFHFCLGCYCGGYSQNGRSNLSSLSCPQIDLSPEAPISWLLSWRSGISVSSCWSPWKPSIRDLLSHLKLPLDVPLSVWCCSASNIPTDLWSTWRDIWISLSPSSQFVLLLLCCPFSDGHDNLDSPLWKLSQLLMLRVTPFRWYGVLFSVGSICLVLLFRCRWLPILCWMRLSLSLACLLLLSWWTICHSSLLSSLSTIVALLCSLAEDHLCTVSLLIL